MPRPSPSVNSAGTTNTSSTCLASARTKPTGTGASIRTVRRRRKYWPGVKPNRVTAARPMTNQISNGRFAFTPRAIISEIPTAISQSTNMAATRLPIEASARALTRQAQLLPAILGGGRIPRVRLGSGEPGSGDTCHGLQCRQHTASTRTSMLIGPGWAMPPCRPYV
ncbi:Uncharacterised protein [Mycobacteroides abscessus subsp. abscessus]|nr:Uncharacterised protein [Mycobacteroides abscessus subsp. abscessus]